MVSIPFSLASVKSLGFRVWYLVAMLWGNKLVKAAAVYTTFNQTINGFLLAVSGKGSWMSVLNLFFSEAYTKFLGAGPNLLEGFKNLNSWDLVGAFTGFWEGVAALIMMFWLYDLVRAKGMTSEVEWPEKALLLGLWLSLSSLVHGTGIVFALFEELRLLLESLQGVLPEFSGNGSDVNVSNVSNGSIMSGDFVSNSSQ